MGQVLSFPGLQRLHYNKIMYCLNLPDSFTYCNARLYQISHYVVITDNNLSKI